MKIEVEAPRPAPWFLPRRERLVCLEYNDLAGGLGWVVGYAPDPDYVAFYWRLVELVGEEGIFTQWWPPQFLRELFAKVVTT